MKKTTTVEAGKSATVKVSAKEIAFTKFPRVRGLMFSVDAETDQHEIGVILGVSRPKSIKSVTITNTTDKDVDLELEARRG